MIGKGTVVFQGRYSPTPETADAGIFQYKNGSMTAVQPTGIPERFGEYPSAQGQVVSYFGSSGSGYALNRANAGSTTLVAQTGDSSPIGNLGGFSPKTATDSTATAFLGVSSSGWALLKGSGGSLTSIVKSGDVAPTGNFGDVVTGMASFSMDNGVVAFSAAYNYNLVDHSASSGVFTGDGSQLILIAKNGDPVPNASGYAFRDFQATSISENTVAFLADFTDGTDTRTGIFVSNDGLLSAAVSTGDALFGSTVTSLNFGQFGLDDSNNGSLAFGYTLDNGISGIASAALVPEPSTWAMVILGFGMLIVEKGRKGQRSLRCLREITSSVRAASGRHRRGS